MNERQNFVHLLCNNLITYFPTCNDDKSAKVLKVLVFFLFRVSSGDK